MLAHFTHPAVWVSYLIVVLVSLLGFEYFHTTSILLLVVVAMSTALVVVDHTVHRSIHAWDKLGFPWLSALWVTALGLAVSSGFVVIGWQLAGLYVAQAIWDNSWHAAAHHREVGEPRGDLDYPIVRWGVLLLAFLVAMVPSFL